MEPFSVFLPVYNEEAILVSSTERLVMRLEALGTPHEVWIGSNGSTDGTVELGEEMARRHPQVRFFQLPRRGPGAALRTALGRMGQEFVVCLDMDLSVGPEFVPTALESLERCDIVVGAKKLGVENRSLPRRLGSDVFIALSKKLLGLPFDDYSIGAKGYRRSVLLRYEKAIDDWTFYVQRVLYEAHRDGLRIEQVPVRCDDERRSRFNLLNEGFYRCGRLLQLWTTRLRSRELPRCLPEGRS